MKGEFCRAAANTPCGFACECVAASHGAVRMCCTAECVCAANLLTSETAKFNPRYLFYAGTFLNFKPRKELFIISDDTEQDLAPFAAPY